MMNYDVYFQSEPQQQRRRKKWGRIEENESEIWFNREEKTAAQELAKIDDVSALGNQNENIGEKRNSKSINKNLFTTSY